ncbi:MAG: hypothetical protein U0531_21700 [Dehalococcoidia bacterium]
MTNAQLDDLIAYIRTRSEAAARDKRLYDRNGARLNAQLLQGEINMGAAVLTWIAAARAGAAPTEQDDEDEGEPA